MSFDLKIENGDLVLGADNDLAIVEKVDKLVQDMLKIVSTQLGSNPFFPWYGSPISKALVGRPYDSKFVSSVASQQLQATLETLQKLQKEQLLKSGQYVSPEEQIAAIRKISVEQNITDPRYYRILINAINKAYQLAPASLDISI